MRLQSVTLALTALAVAAIFYAPVAEAQRAPRRDYDYRSGRRMGQHLPRNYEQYYYSNRGGYTLSPYLYVVPENRQPMILGPVKPYTASEYARLIESTFEFTSAEPAHRLQKLPSIVVEAPGSVPGLRNYEVAETEVIDVLDRGVLMTGSREEVRLRGARFASDKDPNPSTRYFARESARFIRNLTDSAAVRVEFREPLRDRDGTLLGKVTLDDGRLLNRLVIEMGYARAVPEELDDDIRAEFQQLEEDAREQRIGLWSNF